ncbi:hypothetical protein FB567DRAFT_587861 [Paraphoma chrysanthemicola]|uniref:F-box domain-containing protein n=1 Tax=Paraphoma chrysanthemicola TaxID=798071 RepID=A0A8K0REH7_9PLEO|nr:hypothetical protein FB567DRAFT_587861 [Paraphoma chrysanthemicola]
MARKSRSKKTAASAKEPKIHRRLEKSGGQQGYSPFLELPAEIRNTIYIYCQPDVPKRLVRKPLVPGSDPLPTRHAEVLGLTQVNKQVRDEFLPIYWKGVSHSVRFQDIDTYVNMLPDLPKGTIAIITILYGCPEGTSVDVAPLLRLCVEHPNLTVDFRRGDMRTTQTAVRSGMMRDLGPVRSYYEKRRGFIGFDDLLELIIAPSGNNARQKWLNFVDKAVKELYITFWDHNKHCVYGNRNSFPEYKEKRDQSPDVRIFMDPQWRRGSAGENCTNEKWIKKFGYSGPMKEYLRIYT